MTAVDEVTKIVGISETVRWRKHADRLVTPGAVERVFGHRQQFDVRESHGLDVLGQYPCVVRDRFLLHVRGEEVEGDDPGHDHDEGYQELEEGGENDAALALRERCRPEGALGNVLVEAPVVEVRDPEADDEGRPR